LHGNLRAPPAPTTRARSLKDVGAKGLLKFPAFVIAAANVDPTTLDAAFPTVASIVQFRNGAARRGAWCSAARQRARLP
jgi:hypothetical protein